MKEYCKTVISAWQKFWFESDAPYAIAVFRIIFGVNLLIMYVLRGRDLEFLFSDKGFVSAAQAKSLLPGLFQPAFYWFPESFAGIQFLHFLYLGFLLLFLVGLGGRAVVIGCYVLHLSFMQRNFSVVYGADIVSCFWFFALCFMNTTRVWSVDALLRERYGFGGFCLISRFAKGLDGDLSSMGRRILQIQLCILYGYTGLEKLRGATWWQGTAVWEVLANRQVMMFDLSFMRDLPMVIAFMTFSAVLFEIYFPALVWGRFRNLLLLVGCGLHIGIALGMGLVFFSVVMISAYLLWFDDEMIRRLKFNRIASRFN